MQVHFLYLDYSTFYSCCSFRNIEFSLLFQSWRLSFESLLANESSECFRICKLRRLWINQWIKYFFLVSHKTFFLCSVGDKTFSTVERLVGESKVSFISIFQPLEQSTEVQLKTAGIIEDPQIVFQLAFSQLKGKVSSQLQIVPRLEYKFRLVFKKFFFSHIAGKRQGVSPSQGCSLQVAA